MADETNGVVRYTDAWLIDVDGRPHQGDFIPVSYTHLRAHET